VPPLKGCPKRGPPSPEVTGAFCRVPSTSFPQSPWYTLPVHPCRFGVRSHWPRNINLVPIDYAFRPRLRGRLTLRGLTLRRNPWTFGGHVSHMPLTLLMSAFALLISPQVLTDPASQTYRTLRYRLSLRINPQLRCMALAPVHFRRRLA